MIVTGGPIANRRSVPIHGQNIGRVPPEIAGCALNQRSAPAASSTHPPTALT
ncbi:hypothetical protein BN439_0481 [Erwinia amylovora Ea644]|nr:hypothetical protein BN439_0481 [Erwinia amylovora Ea644]